MRALLLTILTIFIFTGCYFEKHNVEKSNDHTYLPLKEKEKIFISLPDDGQYGNINYKNSGFAVANSIKTNVFQYSKNIEIGQKVLTLDEAISYAKSISAIYLYYPTILHWEDRNTAWSGLADKVHINISVIDILLNKEVSSTDIKSNSSYWTLSNESPKELIDEPISKYINTLYNKQ
ncbi:DUF4823 domain-containing protein [Aliarcobacter cryaerophilus]|uniref:DUF4823 domain-containing protein n=1 Tax=Aliarcobacter cryaerophilus TaxID=28198 RepID=UPI0021B22183|nr:DUF4823 domain-containing protein [Aliarcobacter cryaerophilus]MCT7464923.1 DUF4823 domain-containing protein [Aliarcobacter cryaerophilus]